MSRAPILSLLLLAACPSPESAVDGGSRPEDSGTASGDASTHGDAWMPFDAAIRDAAPDAAFPAGSCGQAPYTANGWNGVEYADCPEGRRSCPPVALGRNEVCQLVYPDGLGGMVTFHAEERIGSNVTSFVQQFPGTGIDFADRSCESEAERCNFIIESVRYDGYAGRRPDGTQCLTVDSCPPLEWHGAKDDLVHVWPDMRADAIVFRNVVIENAWKVCPTCPTGEPNCCNANPHTDGMQVWGGRNHTWNTFVLQNSVMRNSDDQILLMTEYGSSEETVALVIQGVRFEQEEAFVTECAARAARYDVLDSGCGGGPNRLAVSPDGTPQFDIWLVDLEFAGTSRFVNGSAEARFDNHVVQVGDCDDPYHRSLSFNDGGYACYDSIEAALAAGEQEPPFLRLSCHGWADPATNAPNCETRR